MIIFDKSISILQIKLNELTDVLTTLDVSRFL